MTNSPNAYLASLATSAGDVTPGPSRGRTRFAIHVPNGVSEISVAAVPDDANAAMTIQGAAVSPDQFGRLGAPISIEPGHNIVPIEIVSADGAARETYQLKIVRAQATLDWVKHLDEGPFPARDSAGEVVFAGRMWLLGGYLPELVDDVWSSADGIEWRREASVGASSGINIPLTFVHGGRMWVSSQSGEFFASADGRSWEMVSAAFPWGNRYAAGCAVFQGKMWVLGGQTEGKLFNDIWCSEDGIDWRQATPQAEWSPRQLFSNVVVFDDKLWIVGGGVTVYQPFCAYRDVWCSADGIHWERVTDHAAWPARIWSNCLVYRDRIFLLGGFRGQPRYENLGDVWYSADGKDWHRLETENCWSARHELSAYTFLDRIWMVAGNPWPLFNDVWSIDISGLTFLSQPVTEVLAGTLYTYRSHADFHADRGALRYVLRQAPEWLKIDEASGVIEGLAPASVDSFEVTLEACAADGETARQAYRLYVQPL